MIDNFQIVKVNRNTITIVESNRLEKFKDKDIVSYGYETVEQAENAIKQRFNRYNYIPYNCFYRQY